MLGKSTHLQVIPQQSTQNSKFAITDIQEKPAVHFLLNDTGVGFSSRNNFANLGSFSKVSVPVESIIFLLHYTVIYYLVISFQ